MNTVMGDSEKEDVRLRELTLQEMAFSVLEQHNVSLSRRNKEKEKKG